MSSDQKITISLFLTWVVFGLFNLFGQPEAFVPPIIIDGLMVVGLGIYFLIPFNNVVFSYAILSFILIIFALSSLELNWIQPSLGYLILMGTFVVFTILFLFIGYLDWIRENKRIAYVGIIFTLLLLFSFLMPLFPDATLVPHQATIIYALLGIISFIQLYFSYKFHPNATQFIRFNLLYLLHFLFDMGNYLALLQFTVK